MYKTRGYLAISSAVMRSLTRILFSLVGLGLERAGMER